MSSGDSFRAKLAPADPFYSMIQDAYRLFSVAKPTSTDVCDCCMDKAVERDFFRPSIEDLPIAYVQDWYFAAYDPSGVSKQTWSYLLPRILEILAAGGDVSTMSLEVNLCRFETGNPDNWSAKQWAVLDQFQRTYLPRAIEDGPDPLDDVLCMFRLGGWQLDDLLSQVAALPTNSLVERLWKDWCKGVVPGRESIWITAFWPKGDNGTVFDFYTSPMLHSRISKVALDEATTEELRTKAFDIASIIENSSSSAF